MIWFWIFFGAVMLAADRCVRDHASKRKPACDHFVRKWQDDGVCLWCGRALDDHDLTLQPHLGLQTKWTKVLDHDDDCVYALAAFGAVECAHGFLACPRCTPCSCKR